MRTAQGIFTLALIVFAIVAPFMMPGRGRPLLEKWAAQSGLGIVSAERRFLRRGPFLFRSQLHNALYRVVVRDPEGNTRSGYVRCGNFWLGMWLSDEVTVEWDK